MHSSEGLPAAALTGTQHSIHTALSVTSLCTTALQKFMSFSFTHRTLSSYMEEPGKPLLSAPQMIVCLVSGKGFMDWGKPSSRLAIDLSECLAKYAVIY